MQNFSKIVHQVSALVSDATGIQLGPKQAAMVESRLRSRMIKLKIDSEEKYLEFLQTHWEEESQALVSLLTTHHTYFFREFSHFEYLLNNVLLEFIQAARKRSDKTIYIWSAACSRGPETYSLALFFHFHLQILAPDVKFMIYGTDIDPESLEMAKNGVYKKEDLNSVPAMYYKGNWIEGRGNVEGFCKVSKYIAAKCHFELLNLLEVDSFIKDKKFDLIFCRNVFIYFENKQIQDITKNLMKSLAPKGRLVLGVSESLSSLNLNVKLVGPSIYMRTEDCVDTKVESAKKIYEVLCIEDSSAIHLLLEKILTPEYDFLVAGKAKNGQEALDLLSNKKFDVITLDLHMPVMDGLTFLEKRPDKNIPVLIVSSVNRNEQSLGQKALQMGAFDYVEKPSFENLAQAGNEIRSKLLIGIRKYTNLNNGFFEESPSPSLTQNTFSSSTTSKIKVLIVDDSVTIRMLLTKILEKDLEIEIVGQADSAKQAEKLITQLRPDVMTLDVFMPEMDGVSFLKMILPRAWIPTVMITSVSKEEGPYILEALETGAVDYIQKPKLSDLVSLEEKIRERIKIAAKAKRQVSIRSGSKIAPATNINTKGLIVIGSSTGGTEALKVVLEQLPDKVPPILIVQHIPSVFSKAFADRLNQLCSFPVCEAIDHQPVLPNMAYIAPGGKQMSLLQENSKLFLGIQDDPPLNHHKPSVDYLFHSVSQLKIPKVIGVILTGMGSDGAVGLQELRLQGARTIAQDEATSVVFGMPKEAIAKGGVEFILPLEKIASKIYHLIQNELYKEVA